MRLRDFQKMGTVADVARRWSRGESRSAHGRARLTSRRRLAPVLVSSLGALVAAMAFGAAAASAERGHIFEKAFGSAGSGDGQLSEPRGVAVNEASGDVYVSDYGNHRVEQFTSAGAFMAVWGWGVSDGAAEFEVCASGCRAGIVGSGEGQISSPGAIAVDNDQYSPSYGDVYVVDSQKEVVEKFSAGGAYINKIANAQKELYGVAVDAKGQLWTYGWLNNTEALTVMTFTDEVENAFIVNHKLNTNDFPVAAFAVDSEDNLYAEHRQYEEVLSKFNGAAEELADRLNEGPATAVATELSSNDLYIDYGTSVVRVAPSEEQVERLGVGKLANSTGIGVDSSSESVYVTDSSVGTITVFRPEPESAPLTKKESIAGLTGNSATLEANISPQGRPASYHLEYGACSSLAACASAGYEESVPVPDVPIGGGWQVESVSAHVQDLHPFTAYHFRVAATNELGVGYGESFVFKTQAIGEALHLADNREWEMVTPPSKEGALFLPPNDPGVFLGLIQASANGDAIADLATRPTEAEPQGYSNEVSVLSTRGNSGWASQVIAPPHELGTFLSANFGQEFRFFSEDLSRGIVQPFGKFLALSPEATESTAYLRTNYPAGDVSNHCHEGCLTPLVTAKNVPPGTQFGNVCDPAIICGPKFVGATPDASDVVLYSQVALTGTPVPGSGGLYEWGDGALRLVSVLPEGESNWGGGTAAEFPKLGLQNDAARNAISNDGARVVWEGEAGSSGRHLYLRDLLKGETVRLDLPQGGPGGGTAGPLYATANDETTRIVFRDAEKLTPQSSPEGYDLYEYDLNAPEGSRLRDLTVANPGEDANAVEVIGASDDGSYIYFAAAGVLAPGAAPGRCGNTSATETAMHCNLYVSHAGTTTFVAGLSPSDFPDWLGASVGEIASEGGNLSAMTGRVSPNGRWLTFMSQRDLAGYDTRDAVTGKPDQEVYLYDAVTDRLTCASCDPTGARPVGQEYGSGMPLVSPGGLWNAKNSLASLIPSWTALEISMVRHQPRFLSDGGRVFFDSHDALVPQDVNGTWDVYEYEPVGVGDCTTALGTFSEASRGCVSLISSGSSGEESAFLDASEDGGDVFFLTKASLQPQDYDTALDVYDAHQCTGTEPCFSATPVAPPPCDSSDACKPAQSVQPTIFGPGPSQTFLGIGNVTIAPKKPAAHRPLTRAQRLVRALKACRHLKGSRRRAICRRRARKRYDARGVGGGVGRAKGSTYGVPARTGRR